MPDLTHNYLIDEEVWVVDPSGPALFHGTIVSITLSTFIDATHTVVEDVTYSILLDNDAGTLKTTEIYMRYDQSDCLALLAELVDSGYC